MKKYLKRLVKKIKFKFGTIGRTSFKSQEHSIEPYEKTAFKICVKVIGHPNSEFMIAPMSGKRYIRNEELDMFITLDYGRVEITNHVFNYNVKLLNRDWERLIYIYDTETEKRRNNMEKEVSSNIKNSLDHVLQRLNEITDNKR